MITFIIGLILGWLVAVIVVGFNEGRTLIRTAHGIFKKIAGPDDPHCQHYDMKPALNGHVNNKYEMYYCPDCTALYINAQDVRRVHYD